MSDNSNPSSPLALAPVIREAVNYDELDPGIRDVVRLLNNAGFETTDSGDGVSKPREWYDSQCAIPYPNVAATVRADCLLSEADRMHAVLGDGWHVEATYWPGDGHALILATKGNPQEQLAQQAMESARATPLVRELIEKWRAYASTHEDGAKCHEIAHSPGGLIIEHRRLAYAYRECANELEAALRVLGGAPTGDNAMDIIPILDTDDPVFCYQHPPLLEASNPMLVCDRKKGHHGPHSWEFAVPREPDPQEFIKAAIEELHAYDRDRQKHSYQPHQCVVRALKHLEAALAGRPVPPQENVNDKNEDDQSRGDTTDG